MFSFLFPKKTVHSETVRAEKDLADFLKGKPSKQEILTAYSSACVDHDFDESREGRAYARVWKEGLRKAASFQTIAK